MQQQFLLLSLCAFLAIIFQVAQAGEKINCFRCIGKDGCKAGKCDGRACVKYIEKLDDGYNYKYECEQRKPDPEEEICKNVENTGDGIVEIQKKKCLCSTSFCNSSPAHSVPAALGSLMLISAALAWWSSRS